MRRTTTWCSAFLVLTAGSAAIYSLGRGQQPTALPVFNSAPPNGSVPANTAARPIRDVTQLPVFQQQMLLSAQRGAEWLVRWNRPDGRFVNGCLPALQKSQEGDHFLRQAGAAFALARVARVTGEERYVATARQALLTLLLETVQDPRDAQVRTTQAPSLVVNRLGSAGMLLLAIHELPAPGADLVQAGEQLANFVRKQQRADGSLAYGDAPDDVATEAEDPDGINHYPGLALYGLMRSQAQAPAAWKTDVVRKAANFYRASWRTKKNPAMVPWQTAAYAEAFASTKEPVFLEAVCEMNDWLLDLQYVLFDPRHPLWLGGFMSWTDGKAVASPPQVGSAAYAEGLAEACRVARMVGDLPRFQRYREALERNLQFLTTLQYTDTSTRHFADWYRPTLLGAFHVSHEDGNLRIDQTQHAVCAMAQYLRYAADTP